MPGAFDAIADRNLKAGTPLPKSELEQFVLDRTHGPQSRELALDWLCRIDPTALDRLVPGMRDDQCAAFRRARMQRLIDAAAKASEGKDAASKDLYRQVRMSSRSSGHSVGSSRFAFAIRQARQCRPWRQSPQKRLGGEKGEVISRVELGEKIMATPALAGGGLYLRSDKHLWKFANPN